MSAPSRRTDNTSVILVNDHPAVQSAAREPLEGKDDFTGSGERVNRTGPSGYAMKGEPTSYFFKAIRRVNEGEVYLRTGLGSGLLNKRTTVQASDLAPLIDERTDPKTTETYRPLRKRN